MVEQRPPTAEEVRDSNIERGNSKKDKGVNRAPESFLEIHNAYINPQTGKAQVKKVVDDMYVMLEDGKTISLNDLFSVITPDIRLSNLTDVQETYVQWALDMQMTCHQLRCPRAAYTADVLRASVTEPSLARNGFLAKNIQTVRQQSEHIQVEQNKPADRGFIAKLGL